VTDEIRITAEPIDNQRCKFVVSVPCWPAECAVYRGRRGKGLAARGSDFLPARSRRHRADRFGQYRDRGQTVSGTLAGCGQVDWRCDSLCRSERGGARDRRSEAARRGQRRRALRAGRESLRRTGEPDGRAPRRARRAHRRAGCRRDASDGRRVPGMRHGRVTLRQGIEGMLAQFVPASAGSSTSPITPRAPTPTSRPQRNSPRLLLLLPTTTYRTAAFVEAARQIGVELTVASEQASTFEGANPAGLRLSISRIRSAPRTTSTFSRAANRFRESWGSMTTRLLWRRSSRSD